MVSRNYNVQSDKAITLNAKSPNNSNQSNKNTQNNFSKNKQNIHYKQTSVGTQYSSSPKEYGTTKSIHYTYSAPLPKNKYEKSSTIPTYTPTVNQDLSPNIDLKGVTPLHENASTYSFVQTSRDNAVYVDSYQKQKYAPNISSFTNNADTFSVKSFKMRPPTPNVCQNNNANLPTIAENIIEEGEYPVDVGHLGYEYPSKTAKCLANAALKCSAARECALSSLENNVETCCREHASHSLRSNRFQYLSDHPLEITDSLKGYHKYKYQGTHPDSLYRVPALGGGIGGGPWTQGTRRLRSSCRLLRWPIGFAALCISLALLVYFLMPESNPMKLVADKVNSTEWLQEEPPFQQKDFSTSESRIKNHNESSIDGNSIENPTTTTVKNSTTEKPFVEDKNPLNFGYVDIGNSEDAETFVELVPASGVGSSNIKDIERPSSPSPIFPTNISPSVQYGNEHQDEGSNERRTPKKPIHLSPVTDIYDDKFLTQTFAIFYNKEAIDATTADSRESSEKQPEIHVEIEQQEKSEQNAPNFTSGHQNSFGIPIEEAERLKSTTQAAVYNTKVSPTLPSMIGKNKVRSTTVRSRWNTTEDGMCHSTRLSMCRGVLPYDLTTLPLVDGITNFQELDAAVPYFDYILKSGCSPRSRQFVCSLLEPECKPKGMKILPPCRRACKAIAESCQDVIAATLELSQVFNCQQYPEDENECITLSRGAHCLTGELRCPLDGSCVPLHWRCDNINDCPGGTDELHCDDTTCAPAEFRCGGRGTCIPEEWVCDGHQDCPGAEDEASCSLSGDGDVISAASYHPRPARLPRPKLRPQPLPESARYAATSKSTAEYESSKELLMMSDSVLPVIKPLSPLTTRKKIGTVPSTTPRVYQVTSSSSSVSISQSICAKNDPNCRRNRPTTTQSPGCVQGVNCTNEKKMEATTTEANKYDDGPDTDSMSSGTSHSSPCPQGELRCVDGRCITLAQLCDHHTDCTDGADEANCFT